MINKKKWNWKFDKNIADNFNNIAITNIPDYERVIKMVVKIAEKYLSKNSKIIDFWSSLWYTLEKLHNKWFLNIYWVDSSKDMLLKSFNKATLINSDQFPTNLWKFDYIISNWTLHFIKNRESYIKTMYDNLYSKWYVVITEKICTSQICNDLYYDFKIDMWLSDSQIIEKSMSIEWVLVPYTLDWYLNVFQKNWFRSVEIINVFPSFYTFLLRK